MQISSAYQQAAFLGAQKETFSLPVRAAGAPHAVSRNTPNGQTQDRSERPATTTDAAHKSPEKSPIRAAQDIFAAYDLTAISPNEIDELARQLKDARFDDLGFVMALEREGATYRQDMENSGIVYGIGDDRIEADAPINLIEKTRSDLALADRYGQDTERLSAQLDKLEEAQQNRLMTRPPARPNLAESLVILRSQTFIPA